jgi:tetratricopeptide (TPR) repeat protein
LREYAPAADLVAAGERGSENLTLKPELELLRRTGKHEDARSSEKPVVAIVQQMICALLDPEDDEGWRNLLVPERREDLKTVAQRGELIRLLGGYSTVAGRQLGWVALADLVTSNVSFTAEGSDRLGYRVRFAIPAANGAARTLALVVKRGEEYKVLSLAGTPGGYGEAALAAIQQGDQASARQWLDWAREDGSASSFTDTQAAAVISLLWPQNKADHPDRVTAAAASLAARGMRYEPAIRMLRQIRGRSMSTPFKYALDLAIMQGLMVNARPQEALEEATRYHKRYPRSEYGIRCLAEGLARGGRPGDAIRLGEQARSESTASAAALRAIALGYQADRRYKEALGAYRELCKTSQPGATDWNNAAWLSLFVPGEVNAGLEAAMTATRLTQQRLAAPLHTMASIQAELGNTNEARQVMLRYLDVTGGIDDQAWYAFGRIAEQLDLPVVAAGYYGKVKKPEFDAASTYTLAQRRLAALQATVDGQPH